MNPLEAIQLRLKALLALKDLIEREVGALREAKKVLKPFYDVPEITSIPSIEEFVQASEVGITDAVRAALRSNASRKLTATQVRDVMVQNGFDLGKDKYKNPMATIHQVLRRLIPEQVEMSFEGDDRVFQWTEKSTAAVPDHLASIESATKAVQEEMGRIARQWAAIDIPQFDFSKSITLGDLMKGIGEQIQSPALNIPADDAVKRLIEGVGKKTDKK